MGKKRRGRRDKTLGWERGRERTAGLGGEGGGEGGVARRPSQLPRKPVQRSQRSAAVSVRLCTADTTWKGRWHSARVEGTLDSDCNRAEGNGDLPSTNRDVRRGMMVVAVNVRDSWGGVLAGVESFVRAMDSRWSMARRRKVVQLCPGAKDSANLGGRLECGRYAVGTVGLPAATRKVLMVAENRWWAGWWGVLIQCQLLLWDATTKKLGCLEVSSSWGGGRASGLEVGLPSAFRWNVRIVQVPVLCGLMAGYRWFKEGKKKDEEKEKQGTLPINQTIREASRADSTNAYTSALHLCIPTCQHWGLGSKLDCLPTFIF